MTVVGVVVVLGALAVVLMRCRVMAPGVFLFAACWGFLLGSTPAGEPVEAVFDHLGRAVWAAVTSL
ncbi:hypothetical protein [Kineococcus terrestris]|uniref:hypothetical protein n=1 Tax=Kineococcus terrestris TaxID=2044856 RepID=UPI0034DAF14D